jgi:hypothetical protein
MNKPLRVNVTHTDQAEEPQGEQPIDETEPSDEIETDIMDSVPATMKSRARQLIKKLKSNKDFVGWNEQGQMVFKGRSVPSTNIVDLVNDLYVKGRIQPRRLGIVFKSSRTFECTRRYCEKRKPSCMELFANIKPKVSRTIYPPPLECSKKREKNAETILVVHING